MWADLIPLPFLFCPLLTPPPDVPLIRLLHRQARVEIEALHEGVDLSETITRARFEELNLDLWWCVLQLFRAPRGRIQPLSQMGQDLQAHDRKWLEGPPRKQGSRSLETITETRSFRNGNQTRDLWKSTRVLLPSLAV